MKTYIKNFCGGVLVGLVLGSPVLLLAFGIIKG